MNANDVIESYVNDVALRLPRRQRNDVAFELRALLHEELQAKAGDAGRDADAAMATEMMRAFGRPADVAARYRPTLTIIDPADGHAFLRAAVIGLAIIWSLGLLMHLKSPIASESGVLTALGQWWGTKVIPSLWWPGVLVVWFGAASWARRRWPQGSEWKPRAGDQIEGGRAALMLGLVGIVCGLYVLVDPHWLLDTAFGGRAAPAAYEALTYTETFRHRQAPVLLVLLMLNIPLWISVAVNGRWSVAMRRIERWLSLILCAVMTWTVLDGPAFLTPVSDRTFKAGLVLITAVTLMDMGIKRLRTIRPNPNRQLPVV